MEIDNLGLEYMDRTILKTIIEKFNGGPVGIQSLASYINEDVGTIEEVYEPFLSQIGLIKRTPNGRKVTKKAYEHLKKGRKY